MKCQLKLKADYECEGKVMMPSMLSDGASLTVCAKHLKAYHDVVKLIENFKDRLGGMTAKELEELANE